MPLSVTLVDDELLLIGPNIRIAVRRLNGRNRIVVWAPSEIRISRTGETVEDVKSDLMDCSAGSKG